MCPSDAEGYNKGEPLGHKFRIRKNLEVQLVTWVSSYAKKNTGLSRLF